MSIMIHIPQAAEESLRAEWGGDLEKAAVDALLIESYRTGRISVGYLAEIIGVTRWQAEEWLASRGVCWNYDLAELEFDRHALAHNVADDVLNAVLDDRNEAASEVA